MVAAGKDTMDVRTVLLLAAMASCKPPKGGTDPNGNMTGLTYRIVPIREEVYLKAEPISWGQLDEDKRCLLKADTGYSLAAAPKTVGSHLQVVLQNPPPGCALAEGWLFASDVHTTTSH